MSAEAEPRRSVRATKGQHKALDTFDQPEPPKKRGKKGKKAAQEAEEEEEIIRCICGATEQDEDNPIDEFWIACEECAAWQHQVCVGVPTGTDLGEMKYWCEQCHPQDHKELLDALSRGEKLWESRQKEYLDGKAKEESKEKKKKGTTKKGKGKRNSDPKEEPEASPAPAVTPVPEPKKEPKVAAGGKRKARDDESQEKEAKPSQKLRKVAGNQAVPVPAAAPATPAYTPPEDLATKISELPEKRQNAAKGLSKSLSHAMAAAEKRGEFTATDGLSTAARAERFALQIERAVRDSHPAEAYANQSRTLVHNLKSNHELALGLLKGTLTPPMLAAMTTEELASKEHQRETAEMKARAEKQSILLREEQAPRVRRTHKGEEIVSDDTVSAIEEAPLAPVRRPTLVQDRDSESLPPPAETEDQKEPSVELPEHIEQTAAPRNALHIDTAQSPKTDFDINKVFSSVKSPSATANRRQSTLPTPSAGPGIDPEVDRMLQDDGNDSPPYSPTEESDPDVVWRGNLLMNTIADLQVVAKHVGGANLAKTISLPWASLFPKRLTVAGRIDQQKAIEYLCSLRYSALTDIVVTSLEPASDASSPAYHKIFDYFVSKARYGVVGDKGVGNVRDTYLIPVLPGNLGHPEFMLNLNDNFIPQTRTEKMLLCVFVYRNDQSALPNRLPPNSLVQAASQSPVISTPTPAQGALSQRNQSISGPQFSPASPQVPQQGFQSPRNNQTPVQPPHVPHNGGPSQVPVQPPAQQLQQPPPPQQVPGITALPTADAAQREAAQRQGERIAREVLGPLISSPTLAFIIPHAYRMLPKEWHLIREVYERDPVSREDLNRLSKLLAEGSAPKDEPKPTGPSPPAQQPQASQQGRVPQSHQPQPQGQPRQQPQPARPARSAQQPQQQQPHGGQPQAQLQQPQAFQVQQQHHQLQGQLPAQHQQQQQRQQQHPQPPQLQGHVQPPRQPQQPPQPRAPPAQQTPIPPPVLPPQRTTPIPPPAVPAAAGPPKQTPIPPPNIPHHTNPAAAPGPAGTSSAPTA